MAGAGLWPRSSRSGRLQAPYSGGPSTRLDVAASVITRALDRLELGGLAKRSVDPADRRSIVVALTTVDRVFVEDLGALMKAASANLAAME
jgi:DNA-binding MarR family transcriptional regulator